MSVHGWGPPNPQLFSAFLAALIACGEEAGGDGGTNGGGQCPTAGEVRLPNESEAGALGTVKVRDLDRRPIDAFGARTPGFSGSQLTGIFRTITSTGAEPDGLVLGSCIGVIGLPEQDEDTPEDIGPLTFSFPDEDLTLVATDPDTNPRYFSNLVGVSVLPVAGSSTVSGGGNGSFPPFTISAETVRPMRVSAPPIDGSFTLPSTGFRMRWNPDESSDFVQLTVAPIRRRGDEGTGGQLVCTLADTGCFGLDANHVNFLRQAQVEAYNATIRRVRGARIEIAQGVEVELEVLSEVVFGIQENE